MKVRLGCNKWEGSTVCLVTVVSSGQALPLCSIFIRCFPWFICIMSLKSQLRQKKKKKAKQIFLPYIFNIAYIMYSNKLYIQLHFGSLMKSAVFPHVQLKYVSWGKELTFGFCVCHPINIMYVRQDFSCWKTGLESFRFQPSPLITLFTKVQQHKNRNLKDKHTVFLVRIRRRQTYSPMALLLHTMVAFHWLSWEICPEGHEIMKICSEKCTHLS